MSEDASAPSRSRHELKSRIAAVEGNLMYERQMRKQAEQALEKATQKVIKSWDTNMLRGGSLSPQEARLVGARRTPSGAFFIGMDAEYVAKPHEIAEDTINKFAKGQMEL
mmetsp:Transcript_9444/g.10941  ORF Transcript_9444/g.10941 Transcript_9444/m.10941 type:complete len:110 (+) Transcript_9444:98-427(+)|eukprot:CAMPEP_0197852498 /NCGR_PEP_ID=MMETSP1438-20131217/20757_1 /TAXON_ID=1461541 /ORGANISM="Pterosperma sp., Strain CCMP1384" /LENGTH=109 /DNA_ID=CAMNT_0043466579 /DNA_START=96 /DNA_END=425 /DNA_ORIENTATION=-